MDEKVGTKQPCEDTSLDKMQERTRPTASVRKKRESEVVYVKKKKIKVAQSANEGALDSVEATIDVEVDPSLQPTSEAVVSSDAVVDISLEHASETLVSSEAAVHPSLEPASEVVVGSVATELREDTHEAVRGNVEGIIEVTSTYESGDESDSDFHHEERSKRIHDVRFESQDASTERESEGGEDSESEGEESERDGDGEEESESVSDGDGEEESEDDSDSVSEGDGEEESVSESEREEIVDTMRMKGKAKVVAKGKAKVVAKRTRKVKSKGKTQPSGSAPTEFPGGPKNLEILKGFKTHVARYIWDGQDREPLKCVQHVPKIFEWQWKNECKKFKTRVNNTPLCQLMQVSYTHINRVLISTFIECWHPETNTFHLPFGEMTITLDDVKQITGLPIVGKAMRTPDIRKEDAIRLLHKFLGVSRDEALDELRINRCNYVRMEWLRKNFECRSKDRDSDAVIDRHVRAYLLYLLGCSLFSDKTGSKVPVTYLNLLSDIGDVPNYAWGAAALAYLYRQLGVATRIEVKQIAGYLTLMEAWIYDHFTVERPTPNLEYVNGKPRSMKWKPRSSISAADAPNRLKFLRQEIDNMLKENVIWDPYRDSRDDHLFESIAWYCGCIAFYEQVEPYHPARVLRQFGYVQTNPWNHSPIPPTKANRGSKANLYSVEHVFVEHNWMNWTHHCLSISSRGELCDADSPWMCEDGYEEWFSDRSHVRIHPTNSTSTHPHIQRSIGDAYIDLNNRRKKAITLLQESLQLGERQTMDALLNRVRQAVNFLNDDTIADTSQANVQEEGTNTNLLGRGTSRRLRGRASTSTQGRGRASSATEGRGRTRKQRAGRG